MSKSKYGLIVPNKNKSNQLVFQSSKNVFGDGSDSDEESKKPVKLRPSDLTNRQAKIAQEKAVLEDPTVYQYDEIYDEMANKIHEEKNKTKEVKKPRYIENLLKTANKRKIETERRKERQIQKEREKEGEEFADKEVFVTSAYKKKLEELRQEEEKEKREEYLESIGDVTKQQGLGGFYRHLYEQKLGSKIIDTEKSRDTSSHSDKDAKVPSEEISENKTKKKEKVKSSRNYRKRKACDDNSQLSEGEIEDSEEEDEINRVNLQDIRAAKKTKYENLDADSDFSIDESSDEDEVKKKAEPEIVPKTDSEFTKPQEIDKQETKDKKVLQEIKENSKITKEEEIKQITEIKEPKVKIDIWAKRTVGKVFDEAVQRYFERKAARGS